MPGCALLVLAVAVAAVVHGCAHEANPACAPGVLVNIDAREQLKIAAVINSGACDKFQQVEDCPALQPIMKGANAEREEWARCH
jgi:hypothetical protein